MIMATNSKIFNKGKYVREQKNDGGFRLVSDIAFPKRGLVIMNSKNTIITIDARCRNTDKRSIAKCMVKAILAEERALISENGTQAVEKSGNTQSSYVKAVMSCDKVIVTNNDAEPIDKAVLSVRGCTMNGVFRDIFKFDKKREDGIYKLVVVDGLKWDDERVITAMKWFVEAAVQHMSYLAKFDEAQQDAAKSTEAEADKADAEARKRAEAKAAKEAAKAVKAA